MASYLGHGKKCIRGDVNFSGELLENSEKLFGWKIQKGELCPTVISIILDSLIVYLQTSTNASSGSRRSPSQCRTMAIDIVKLYITLISENFKLSDVSLMANNNNRDNVTPPLLPIHSNSFTTVQFLMKILGEIQDCVNEVNGMEISGEVTSGLKSLLESVRWRFEDILIHAWLRGWFGLASELFIGIDITASDANVFYMLESWIASPTDPSTTLYLSHMEVFQRQITTAAFKIAGGVDLTGNPSAGKLIKQNPVPSIFISKITKAFLDVLYAFLDGLAHLASDDSPVGKRQVTGDSVTVAGTNPLDLLDLTDAVSQSPRI